MKRVVVIGAGIGGLAAASALARAGLDVTVLEAQVYPGGCAGTFYHQGYRFDAGATLAGGFYPGGPMDLLAQAAGICAWPTRPADTVMAVHLPDSEQLLLTAGEERWQARRQIFGARSDDFFRWQETTAEALWEFALLNPDLPPQTISQLLRLVSRGLTWLGQAPLKRMHPRLLSDAFRPVAARLHGAPSHLRKFVDAQLLISAQATSLETNALYGAAALDLPRRGVVHLEGGMGAIAQALVQAVRRSGGDVHFRQEAVRVNFRGGRPETIETKRGGLFPADLVIFNLTPDNILPLLGEQAPKKFSRRWSREGPPAPQDGWGAFVVYAGLEAPHIPDRFPLHHQVVLGESLGEGNSVFLSISPTWDQTRAPQGHRAVTISTHTALAPWWNMYQAAPAAYQAAREDYTQRLLAAAEVALPGLGTAIRLALPGTPVTFQNFTRRSWGWVGGIPQTSLARAAGPALTPGTWMVGDSIFPGQSVPAVALGGLRVAEMVLQKAAQGVPRVSTGKRFAPAVTEGFQTIEGSFDRGGKV